MADIAIPTENTVPIYDISGPEPVLGNISHDEVQQALSSGKYSLPQGHQVHVVSPDGDFGTIDAHEAPDAFKNGYQYATPQMLKEYKYGGAGQGAKAFLEGVGEGAAGPLAPLAEKALGVKEEDIRGRKEVRSGLHGAGQVVGLTGGLLTGTGEAAVMGKAGKLAQEAVGLANVGHEATFAAKVGSEAVKQAAEMAVLQGSDEVAKQVLHDPDATAQTAIANIGLSAALGAGGGAFVEGAVSPLWKATAGPKVEALLGGLKSKLNGESEAELIKEAKGLGLSVKPEIEAAMSDDPMLRNAASTLRQTDTSKIARGFQETESAFRDDVANKMVETLGKDPKTVSAAELSEAEHGKGLGDALVREYKSKLDPIIKDLEETKGKFGDAELLPDVVNKVVDNSNPYQQVVKEQVTPGTVSQLADKISQKAIDEGWMADRLSPESRMIRSTLKELKAKGNLNELVKLGQNIGNSTKSTLPFGMQTPLSRAGTIVRDILREGENEVILSKIGKEAPELLEKYRGALESYKELAHVKDALNDRLKVNGSVSGFAKGLAEMSKTDSETLLNRLKGTKDANLLSFLKETFPETAQKLKEYHVESLLKKATMIAQDGEGQAISASKLTKAISGMSPELREFTVGREGAEKITKLNEFLTKLNDSRHNFSNTARTVDKILQHGPTSAIGLAAMLSGHGAAALLAPVAELVSREGSSGVRLAMLRFLGSSQPIESAGFKAMVDFLHNTYKGENILAKASKAVFKSGAQVLATHLIPDDKDREKLDKKITQLTENPQKLEQLANNGVGHYLPEHQTALTQTSAAAVRYLSDLKPKPFKPGPLDREIEPTPQQMARYHRALDIAQQPAIVLQHVKDGTLQATDIQDLNAMYPGVYKQMTQKLTNEMISHKAGDEPIPYKTRIGISLFLGQPMDVSMQPASIMAAQPKTPSRAAQGQQGAPKGSPKALGKSNKMYQTPEQASEADRQNK